VLKASSIRNADNTPLTVTQIQADAQAQLQKSLEAGREESPVSQKVGGTVANEVAPSSSGGSGTGSGNGNGGGNGSGNGNGGNGSGGQGSFQPRAPGAATGIDAQGIINALRENTRTMRETSVNTDLGEIKIQHTPGEAPRFQSQGGVELPSRAVGYNVGNPPNKQQPPAPGA
jgi:hypothetical protein